MGSIPTNPKPWICRRSSYRHSYGISSCPQVNAARVRARPAPPFPAPIKVGGQRAAHVHKQNQPFILCPTGQRCPHSYQSAHCCSFPGFLGLSCRFCPGQVISWQQVPSRSPGARSPAGGGAGEAGSRAGGRRPNPPHQSSGSLPVSELGRSQESSRYGRAAVGAAAHTCTSLP